jgi:hypothetical protein
MTACIPLSAKRLEAPATAHHRDNSMDLSASVLTRATGAPQASMSAKRVWQGRTACRRRPEWTWLGAKLRHYPVLPAPAESSCSRPRHGDAEIMD